MASLPDNILEQALTAVKETDRWDFKSQVDLNNAGEFIELIKDIVAITNSGGGVILIGVNDDGVAASGNISDLLKIDPANVTNKIFSYTGTHFHHFEFRKVSKSGIEVCGILIGSVDVPLVFTKPGTYELADKKQKNAFSVGTVYFRHGAKSEPGTSDDLRQFITRSLERTKKSLLEGIAKVVEAPVGTHVAIISDKQQIPPASEPTSMRVTYSEDAPEYRAPLIDKTHPFRQKELLEHVNARLAGKHHVSTHDFLCVRRVHNIHRDLKYCFNLNWSSPRYSQACIDWLIAQIEADSMFLHRARESHARILAERKVT